MRISDWSSDVCSSDLHRRVERVDRDQADRRIGRAVGGRGHIALTGIGGQLHVERRAFVEMADDEIGVEHVDIAGHRDVAGLDRAGAGGGKLEQPGVRSEEHTSELQSLMRRPYAVLCMEKKKINK